MPVTPVQFRPPFASLHSLFVSALTFRRLAHLHPRLHRQFVTGQQLSDYEVKRTHRRSLVVSERLLQEVKNFWFACSEKPIIPLGCIDVDDRWQHIRTQSRR